jgi:hypothetical protein
MTNSPNITNLPWRPALGVFTTHRKGYPMKSNSAQAQVVKFRSPRRPVDKRPDHPDGALIEHCMEYSQIMKGASAAFAVDPTDGEFAGPADTASLRRADRALTFIAGMRATTLDGISAKAAIERQARHRARPNRLLNNRIATMG